MVSDSMTRAEHVRWCKARALECLERDGMKEAIASMVSDLRKHPETQALCGPAFMYSFELKNLEAVRRWIIGFIE
jgi:hypothetical protein